MSFSEETFIFCNAAIISWCFMKANDFLPRHCVVLAATTCLHLLFVFHCPENCFQSRPPQPQKHFCLFLQMGTERLNCDTWLNSMAGTLFVFFCQEDSFKAPSPNSNEHLKFFFIFLIIFVVVVVHFYKCSNGTSQPNIMWYFRNQKEHFILHL